MPRTADVFLAFLRLGFTSFGGPVAHLAYFREAFVIRRAWLSEAAYAELVALSHFLPGPASSQVGMAIGRLRAGTPGMLAAWVAFTLPSALALTLFALGLARFGDAVPTGTLTAIKAAVVGVVAHALLGMARTLVSGPWRTGIALAAMTMLLMPAAPHPALVILLAALVTSRLPITLPSLGAETLASAGSRQSGLLYLAAFFGLLALLPIAAALSAEPAVALIDRFYRTGSVVFGGGHVVLPMLEAEVVATGQVPANDFLTGYAAAQVIPGPLFSFAAFIGAIMPTGLSGLAGAALALLAIFLPSALLIAGVLPLWARLRTVPSLRRALTGANAATVGLLAAALWDPVIAVGVVDFTTGLIAILSYTLLAMLRVPAWGVVIGMGIAGSLGV